MLPARAAPDNVESQFLRGVTVHPAAPLRRTTWRPPPGRVPGPPPGIRDRADLRQDLAAAASPRPGSKRALPRSDLGSIATAPRHATPRHATRRTCVAPAETHGIGAPGAAHSGHHPRHRRPGCPGYHLPPTLPIPVALTSRAISTYMSLSFAGLDVAGDAIASVFVGRSPRPEPDTGGVSDRPPGLRRQVPGACRAWCRPSGRRKMSSTSTDCLTVTAG
jgi:hypothetical protein